MIATVLRLRRRLVDTENEVASSWVDGSLSADTVREAIREFAWHRDRFATTYREALRLAPAMSKQEIEEVVEAALQVCQSAIALRDTLRGLVNPLAAGQLAAEVEDLERAGAEFERWLEGVPDEMLLHYGPVTDAVEKIAIESLRNPPSASDWRSLFDEGANSPP